MTELVEYESLELEAPCGLVTTTPDGTIIRANEAFLRLTGYSLDDLAGRRTFAELLTVGGRIYHETHFAPLLQMQGSVRNIAFDLVAANGARLPVLVNALLERRADGSPIVIRAAIFEASERRAYERELLRAKEEAEAAEQRSAALARTLQQTLIPPLAPTIPGLEVATAYRPAGAGDEVGGDFYDVFQVDEDDWVIVVGDVQGKGVDAAVITSLVRHAVRAAAVLEQEPSEILDTVNTVLCRDGTDRFCTLVIVRLMRIDSAWRASISIGGHSLPLLCRRERVPERVGNVGSLIGIWEKADVSTTVLLFEPGDVLLLYTDGVTEARSGSGFFGEARLARLAAANGTDAANLTRAVVADAVTFQNGVTRDDIVVVAVGVPAD